MALSRTTLTGDGVTNQYAVPFPYIKKSHVNVEVDGVTAPFTWVNPALIQITSTPAALSTILIYRNSSKTARLVDYTAGPLDEETLDADSQQAFYLAQESIDRAELAMGTTFGGVAWDALAKRITNSATPALANDVATKDYVDTRSGTGSGSWTQDGTGAATISVVADLKRTVRVSQFTGVDPTGVADSTTGIQNALNSLPFGGTVMLGRGTFKVTGLTIPAGVVLEGETPYQSVLITSSTNATVAYMNTSAALRRIKIDSSVARTASFFVDVQGNGVVLDELELSNYFIGISIGTLGSPVIVGTRIINPVLRNPSILAGTGGIQALNFSNTLIVDGIVTGPNTGDQPGFGIRFQNGDTAFISGTNVTKHGKGLWVDTPAPYNCYALTIDGSLFDSAGTINGGTTVASGSIAPAGGVYNTRISNTWFGLSTAQQGLYIGRTGAGTVDGIVLDGCEFTDNGDSGLVVDGPGVKNWSVIGGHAGGNTASGIRAAAGTTDWSIVGFRAGNIAGRGPNNNGISVDAASSNRYNIIGCNLRGNATAGLVDSGTGTDVQVIGNLGYNYGAPLGVALTGSPMTITAGHTPETLYFYNGTISDVKVGGQTVLVAGPGQVQLGPNEAAVITYTGTPIISRKRM
jgi:hypothetical protein